jgi:sugar O-acyltransferase (sialic acid O-acetyltransferase NeuD family)
MIKEVYIPKVSANDLSATIVEVNSLNGVYVNEGDIVFVVETTKAAIDVVTPISGFFFTKYKNGDSVQIDKEICYISDKNNDSFLNNKQEIKNTLITKKAKLLIEEHNLDISNVEEKIITEKIVIGMLDPSVLSFPDIKKTIKDTIVIVGSGDHGEVAYDLVISAGIYEPVAFINYSKEYASGELFDLPVLGISALEYLFKNSVESIYINTNSVNLTQELFNKANKIGYQFPPLIHKFSYVSDLSSLGKNVMIGAGAIVGTNVNIGNFTKVLNSASVAHHSNIGNFCQISDGSRLSGKVTIGNNCLIGLNASIVNNIVIGDNSIINSGLTITTNIPGGEIVRESI